MPRIMLSETTGDHWSCKVGQPHFWDYRKDRKEYRCRLCGVFVTKQQLKEKTDEV